MFIPKIFFCFNGFFFLRPTTHLLMINVSIFVSFQRCFRFCICRTFSRSSVDNTILSVPSVPRWGLCFDFPVQPHDFPGTWCIPSFCVYIHGRPLCSFAIEFLAFGTDLLLDNRKHSLCVRNCSSTSGQFLTWLLIQMHMETDLWLKFFLNFKLTKKKRKSPISEWLMKIILRETKQKWPNNLLISIDHTGKHKEV